MTNNFDEAGWKARLTAGAAELGRRLDESQLDKLWRWACMLRERNEHVNLTSIVSPEGILTLHMLDSLSIVPDLGDAATDPRRRHGRRLSRHAARGRLSAARVHAHRRHAEEDPLRQRSHRGARHPRMPSRSRCAPKISTSDEDTTRSSCAPSAVSPMYYITPGTWSRPRAG